MPLSYGKELMELGYSRVVIQEYSNAYSTTTVLLLLHGHFGYHVLSYLKPHCTHRTFLPAPSTFNLHSQSIYTFATSEKPAAFWD